MDEYLLLNLLLKEIKIMMLAIGGKANTKKAGIDMQGLGAPEILQNFHSHPSCLEVLVAHGAAVPEYFYANLKQ
ncbi:hypothetical protein KY284_022985 [Solanum tuberosum]|nr:hypothetical protein KY284_022985 [Solanum tuberosum]